MLASKNVSTRTWRPKAWMSILCLVSAGAAMFGSISVAEELPDEVRRALRENVKALSPIHVAWTAQLGSDLSLQDYLTKIRVEPFYIDAFQPVNVTFAWQDGMLYSHMVENKAELTPFVVVDDAGQLRARPDADFDQARRTLMFDERTCNLEHVFCGSGMNGSPGTSLIIDSVEEPKAYKTDSRLFSAAYFREAGYALPKTIDDIREGAKSLPLALIDEGARIRNIEETTFDGRECLLLVLEDDELTKRFFLDPARGYAVLRREEMTPLGKPATVATMSQFVKFADPDIWLPKRCEVEHYTNWTIPDLVSETPLSQTVITVQEMDKRAIPIEQFTLEYMAPGVRILDSTLPGAEACRGGVVRYTVPGNLDDLEAVIQSAVTGEPFVRKAMRESNEALLASRESRRQPVSLTDEQRRLMASMAKAAASINSRSTPVRVAIFDVGLPHGDMLGSILDTEPACTWEWIDALEIYAGALDRFDVILVPGGGGHQHAKALRDKGRLAVQEFVRDGGGYVGICAGAFLARSKDKLSLGLVDCKAVGVAVDVPGQGKVYYDAGTVKIELTEPAKGVFDGFPDLLDASFSGGPILAPAGVPELADYVPLAMYRTEAWEHEQHRGTMVDTPAIVAGQYGSGRALIFSPHPESRDETKPLLTQAVLMV